LKSSPRLHGTVLAALFAGLISGGTAAAATGSTATGGATQTITYQGYQFTVPASWPVIDLTADPTACVRYDQHAVYLGTPGSDQQCPSNVFGHTEALLLSPGAAGGGSTIVDHPLSGEYDAVAPGIAITATYDSDPAEVSGILTKALPAGTAVTTAAPPTPASASTTTPAPATTSRLKSAVVQSSTSAAASTNPTAGSTDFTGEGFDACTAPSEADMSAWRTSSPYDAIGIYIGGTERGCAQPNLTAQWVTDEANAGWHFVLFYVGLQAPGTSCSSCATITDPATQAQSEAQDAVTQAQSLGFTSGIRIMYDMEAYTEGGTNTTTALTFESDWTNDLHALGYQSGVYSSMGSGIADLVSNYTTGTYTLPDVIEFASDNGQTNATDSAIPTTEWPDHQRINQYELGHNETWGDVTISIDSDYVDSQRTVVLPATDTAYALGPGNSSVQEWTGSGSAWINIGGAAGRIYAGDDGVFATNPSGSAIDKYNGIPGSWTKIGGAGAQFAVAGDALFGLSPSRSSVSEWNGTNWTTIGGAAQQLYADGNNLLTTSPGNSGIYEYNATQKTWTKIGGAGAQFAVSNGLLFGLSPSGSSVSEWNGTNWTTIGGAAQNIYGGGFGVFTTSPGNRGIYTYNVTAKSWSQVGGAGSAFAVSDTGLFGLGSVNGAVYQYSGTGTSWSNIGGSEASIIGG
jgi:hypothetical protein